MHHGIRTAGEHPGIQEDGISKRCHGDMTRWVC